MIELPSYITLEEFDTFLDNLYPVHDIIVNDDAGDEYEEGTDLLRTRLLYTAYYELNLAYNMASVGQDLAITAVHHHAVHIWRSEGSRSAREDLIAQGVTQAGVVKETYDQDVTPVSPFLRDLLAPYVRTVAAKLTQRTRDMEDYNYMSGSC